ncbi:dUTP diphosphatase [Rickettsiales endosymbiont of Peranema trichophorum]|uniref:dUTP diphosphatase n=1 Tax=Rickettsiales endosymbiont of Peranema trichophorum TaxID=2486577 RepID=UPI00102327CD|nr:dUTP diphosphatase [Rickettsiales endosymbiont of Peranema trichophorum]RZI46713.1 dUTP diphosphatase [Rickettsiales endosymbiont of Peranema trichophorum]
MNRVNILVKQLTSGTTTPIPTYATSGSAGIDLIAAIEDEVVLRPFERKSIPNGICIALPKGYEAQVRPRSGIALKFGVTVLNSPGTIDSDYRGEICTILINLSTEDFVIQPGMRIAQMVIAQYIHGELELVSELPDSDRGVGGFGSTGLHTTSS